MSIFTITKLAGQRVLVVGDQPEQKTILDSSEWDDVKGHIAFGDADKLFQEQVAAFFAPVTEAADKAQAMVDAVKPKADPAFFVTLEDGIEKIKGKAPVTAVLGKDAAILRILESGDTSRLVWVGADIEIVAL